MANENKKTHWFIIAGILVLPVVCWMGCVKPAVRFTATEQAEIDRFLAQHEEKFGGDVNAVDERGDTLLHKAVVGYRAGEIYRHWSVAVVKFLVANGADVNVQGSSGIRVSYCLGNRPSRSKRR